MSNPNIKSSRQLKFGLGILDQRDDLQSVFSQHQRNVLLVRPQKQRVWRIFLNLVLLFQVALGDELGFLGLLIES